MGGLTRHVHSSSHFWHSCNGRGCTGLKKLNMNEYEVEVDRHTTHATHHRTRSLQASLQSPAGWRRPCEVPATACNRHPQGQYARREARTRYQGNGAFRESGGGGEKRRPGVESVCILYQTIPIIALSECPMDPHIWLCTCIFRALLVFAWVFWQMCRIAGVREIDALTVYVGHNVTAR